MRKITHQNQILHMVHLFFEKHHEGRFKLIHLLRTSVLCQGEVKVEVIDVALT